MPHPLRGKDTDEEIRNELKFIDGILHQKVIINELLWDRTNDPEDPPLRTVKDIIWRRVPFEQERMVRRTRAENFWLACFVVGMFAGFLIGMFFGLAR